MIEDWQPGDLALCVRADWIPNALGGWSKGKGLRKGRIYSVVGLTVAQDGSGALCLVLAGDDVEGCRASRFRKIRPHEPDAEDAETIRLLNGVPAQVPA